jgi:hypothetical protein
MEGIRRNSFLHNEPCIQTEGDRRNSAEIHRTTRFVPFSGYFKVKEIEVFQIMDSAVLPPIHHWFLLRPNPVRNRTALESAAPEMPAKTQDEMK